MDIIKNEETAEIVGLCFGDGSLTRRHSGKDKGRLRFQLRGNITEDKEHYNNYIIPLFEKYIDSVPTILQKGKTPCYGISTQKKSVCDYLVSLGIPTGVKGELGIPKWVFKKKNFMKGFLRGFFDTDGGVFCQKNYSVKDSLQRIIKVSLASTSKSLIEESKFLAENLGIKFLIKSPAIHRKNKDKGWKDLHIIRIESNKNVMLWFKIVGSNNPKHVTKFKVWLKYGFCPPYTTLKQRKMLLNSKISIIDILCGSVGAAK